MPECSKPWSMNRLSVLEDVFVHTAVCSENCVYVLSKHREAAPSFLKRAYFPLYVDSEAS